MNKIVTAFATTLFVGISAMAVAPVSDAEAASKRTGCVQNTQGTHQHACNQRFTRKQTSTVPVTHRSATRRFNFSADPTLSHADGAEGGGGGNGGRK